MDSRLTGVSTSRDVLVEPRVFGVWVVVFIVRAVSAVPTLEVHGQSVMECSTNECFPEVVAVSDKSSRGILEEIGCNVSRYREFGWVETAPKEPLSIRELVNSARGASYRSNVQHLPAALCLGSVPKSL